MSGPYSPASLVELKGPVILWESPRFSPVPASGVGHDFGLSFGQNRGWVAPYIEPVDTNASGYNLGDILQCTPHMQMPVGAPGTGMVIKVSPGRLISRVLQGINESPPNGGAYDLLDGSAAHRLFYRGIFSAGCGPYPLSSAKNLAKISPLLVGETVEFTLPVGSGFVQVPNPTDIEPFMWTLFGRCLSADLECQPGDIMAIGSAKASGSVRGMSTQYLKNRRKFSLGQLNGYANCVGKNGGFITIDGTKWAMFFRFIGTMKGGIASRQVELRKRARTRPLGLWMTPPQPHSNAYTQRTFAGPSVDFTPSLVNSIHICHEADNGYKPGDWVATASDDNNSTPSGYSATFNAGKITTGILLHAGQQTIHALDTGAYVDMTPSRWSWSYVMYG